MDASFETLQSQALELSPQQKVELADRLLSSLSVDGELEAAWTVEAARRLAEVESERMALVPLDLALERARQSLK